MKRFFDEFFKLFRTLELNLKIYYISYSVFISLAYALYSLLPLLYGKVIDQLSFGKDYHETYVFYCAGIVISIFLFRVWSLGNVYMKKKAKLSISTNLFTVSINKKTNDILAFSTHLEQVENLFSDFVYTIPSEILAFCVMLVAIAFSAPIVLFILAFEIVAFLLITLYREHKSLPLKKFVQSKYSSLSSVLGELLCGIPDINMYARWDWAENRLLGKCENYFDAQKDYKFCSLKFEAISSVIFWGASCIIALICFRNVVSHNLTMGVCLAVIQLSESIRSYFISIYQNSNYLIDFLPDLEHINRLLSTNKSNTIIHNDTTKYSNSEIIVDSLAFSLPDKSVFENVSFIVKKDDILLISGESGCGKSTLLSCIVGDIIPKQGNITLCKSAKIGYLPQTPRVLNRTLRENLLIAKNTASDNEILDILKQVDLLDFYHNLPFGLDTLLGENGTLMSGGEKSKLYLARILLQNADIVLLDEPLSNIDSTSKAVVLKNLKLFLNRKTCIIVSHQQDVQQLCNCIYQMESHTNEEHIDA